MEIKEFAANVRSAVKEELGDAYRVELREVRKNNGIIMHGLLIASSGNNVIPTIYLDGFWEAYKEGTALTAIVGRLVRIYREDSPRADVSMEFFRHFDRVRDKICYRLIRRSGNEELLQDIPHLEFLDLALCFFYMYKGDQLGEGSILIRNCHREDWKVKTADLMRAAQINTPELFPWVCTPLETVLEGMGAEEAGEVSRTDKEFWSEVPMRVLTNKRRIQGAACMLYPGLLEKMAAEEKRSLYILPSSVHELILLPQTGGEDPEELRGMIREVNRTHVAPEEVLSDSLYFYDLGEKRVKIIF